MHMKQLLGCALAGSLMLGCEPEDGEETEDGGGAVIIDDSGSTLGDATILPDGNTPLGDASTGTADAALVDAGNGSGGSDAGAAQDSGAVVSPDGGGGPAPSEGCLAGITNYKDRGKFSVKTESAGSVKFWVPAVPAGCKVPVVHLANGTGATCAGYGAILQHLASHGFLATCFENQNTGQGTQCIMALEAAYQKYPQLADDKIGSTGHSQGGGAAFVCVARAEEKWGNSKIIAGHSMEPASGFGDSPRDWATYYARIKSPMFMFNGSADSLVSASWVGQAFDALGDSTEAYWYEATGAAHIPVPTRWTQESAVSWFRWKLLGDKQACEHFKKLPDGSDWALKKKQAEQGC